MVFVDESAESVAALYLADSSWRSDVGRFGWDERESAVRAFTVVMRCVDAEHLFEVTAAEDEEPIETLGTGGADEPFGIGVCLWRAETTKPRSRTCAPAKPKSRSGFATRTCWRGAQHLRSHFQTARATRRSRSPISSSTSHARSGNPARSG